MWAIQRHSEIFLKNTELVDRKSKKMSEADIKLRLIRLIDSQKGEILHELYELILSKLYHEKWEEEPLSAMEIGYKEMSEDKDREEEAFEWIEGTLHSDNL